MIPSPTGSVQKHLGAANIEMALKNLRCFGHKVSLLNPVEDYYTNSVIEAFRHFGGRMYSSAWVLEKILKLPHWGYKHKVCFSMTKSH